MAITLVSDRSSVLFQTHPLGHLLTKESEEGFVLNHTQGTVSLADIVSHGIDTNLENYIGLGTLNGFVGELVIAGQGYLVDATGQATPVDIDESTPFTMAIRFSPDIELTRAKLQGLTGKDLTGISHYLDTYHIADPEKYYALKMVMETSVMHARSVRPPSRLHQPLRELERKFDPAINQSYTLVGFRVPPHVDPRFNIPGYHFHAINNLLAPNGRTDGGHVLDLTARRVHSIAIQQVGQVKVLHNGAVAILLSMGLAAGFAAPAHAEEVQPVHDYPTHHSSPHSHSHQADHAKNAKKHHPLTGGLTHQADQEANCWMAAEIPAIESSNSLFVVE